MNTVIHSSGELLTGKVWRKEHSFFNTLPFYSNIPRMEEMAGPLKSSLSADGDGHIGHFHSLLVKFGQGLDDIHPFSDTPAVDVVLREAEMILSDNSSSIGPKNSSRIWGFMSKFVMVDRFAKALGIADVYPGISVPKTRMLPEDLGRASKFLDELHPPTKILKKFLKTWGDRKHSRLQYFHSSHSSQETKSNEGQDPADVALMLSRRVIAVSKVKSILNIESGLEMMALAVSISSQNSGVFPESAIDVKNVLWRIWSDRMDAQQFDELSTEMQALQKPMKNLMEIVFATSPLLTLSTSGWAPKSIQGSYLLRLFIALGNDRPEILIRIEDKVLQAIIGISDGKSREDVMEELYEEIRSMEMDLHNNDIALNWFNVNTVSLSVPLTPLPAVPNKFQGGLISPPDSQYNSPNIPIALSSLSSLLPLKNLSPPKFVDPKQLHDATGFEDEVGNSKPDKLTDEVSCLTDAVPNLKVSPRPRKSSASSNKCLENNDQDDPMVGVDPIVTSSTIGKDSEEDLLDSSGDKQEKGAKKTVDSNEMCVDTDSSGQEQDDGLKKSTDSNEMSEDTDLSGQNREKELKKTTKTSTPKKAMNSNDMSADTDTTETNGSSVDADLAAQLAASELRRSTRNAVINRPNFRVVPTPKSTKVRKNLKPATRKEGFLVLDDSDDEWPKLSNVAPATFHPTLHADILGWGSTIEAGPKPYRHVPVEIVPPGDVNSTGEDTETLMKVEARIRAEFKDGLPPHLQPDAKNIAYQPGTDQSRIYVSSCTEFSTMDPTAIQKILRHRVILIHGNKFDNDYGWDLKSFGKIYDVDKKVFVQVSSLVHPHQPMTRHHQGTLREFHSLTTPHPNEDFPPLNAISLPANWRNRIVPCQFGSFASHEVAQSCVPLGYGNKFKVPDLKSTMEWSLIGARGVISPFHIDSDGLGTVVIVLEGSKYWILATRSGERENLGSIDSLGPAWCPYYFNEGDVIDKFRFEAVHLQKGDMLVMPPGVLHWVMGTSNAICIGRHFYSASTIRSSIFGIVNTFVLGGSLTNESHVNTRTLLYQLIVFWSMRIDQTDIDGAHIPVLSSEEEFFDIIYLGIFIVLSPAFDARFYSNPPQTLLDEVTYAIRNFYSLIHVFSLRYIILLDGEAVAVTYIVDRMLAEFAAAAVVYARSIQGFLCEDYDEETNMDGTGIDINMLEDQIGKILQNFCPDVISYFQRRRDASYPYFQWSGPDPIIFPRSKDIVAIIQLTTPGELLDFPHCPIYSTSLSDIPSGPATGKRQHPDEPMETRKRKR